MSELSSDARDLVAQARKQGSELLGPSAQQRAQLREKLAPLWAAEAVQPRAARSRRWKLGSLAIVAGLGALGWLYSGEPVVSLPPPAAGAVRTAASDQRPQETSTTSAVNGTAASPSARGAESCAHGFTLLAGVCTQNGAPGVSGNSASTTARGAEPCARGFALRAGVCTQIDAPGVNGIAVSTGASGAEPCARGFVLRAGVCTQIDAPPSASTGAASGQPLAAAIRKAKRVVPPEASPPAPRKAAPQLAAAVPASSSQEPEEQDLLAALGLEGDRNAENGSRAPRRVQPSHKATSERLPLKAAEERTPERAVQTDADPGPPSIDGELELLGAAQTALQKQRPSRALTLLQEHAFRFPTGAMVEERMAMQALALCALQRRHAAQTVLSNLEARGSQSQLLPRVRSQCGL